MMTNNVQPRAVPGLCGLQGGNRSKVPSCQRLRALPFPILHPLGCSLPTPSSSSLSYSTLFSLGCPSAGLLTQVPGGFYRAGIPQGPALGLKGMHRYRQATARQIECSPRCLSPVACSFLLSVTTHSTP